MALIVADRVQELTTTSGTGTLTLNGAVSGFQTFSNGIGNTNTTYYTIYDSTAYVWEVGIGTVGAGTLSRDTVLANSLGTTAKINLAGNQSFVFCTYPAGKSVNLNASGNVSPLGTISSGTWQGTTVGVAYGGTGVTASSGANSVVLRDANQNIAVNRLNQSNTTVTAAAGTTTLTAASSYSQTLVGTGGQTYTMPDATTLTTGVAFLFNNNATGTLTLRDGASGLLGTIASGGAGALMLLDNGTVAGTWNFHGYLPENVTWGTNALDLGTTIVSNGTWQGGTIGSAYGGTGLTTFVGANNALYSTSASALTAGTLPILAGGTGATTAPNARTNLGLGTIATQDANSVAITGGTIDGTTIGATTPSTGAFTSVTTPSVTATSGNLNITSAGTGNIRFIQSTSGAYGAVLNQDIGTSSSSGRLFFDSSAGAVSIYNSGNLFRFNTGATIGTSSGNLQFGVIHTASAVNYLQATGAATTARPIISAQGSDTNISLGYDSKGTGTHVFRTSGVIQFQILNATSAVNYGTITGGATGVAPVYAVAGTDTNIDLSLTTKGTGAVNLNTGGGTQFKAIDSTAAVNIWNVRGGDGSTTSPRFTTEGTGTNIAGQFNTKGTGALQFYTGNTEQFRILHTASAVNYVQVTGSVTTPSASAIPSISTQGSDTNTYLGIGVKGTGGYIAFYGAGATNAQVLRIATTNASGTNNLLQVSAAASGSAPALSSIGTDTDIDLTLTPKGTGKVVLTNGLQGGTF